MHRRGERAAASERREDRGAAAAADVADEGLGPRERFGEPDRDLGERRIGDRDDDQVAAGGEVGAVLRDRTANRSSGLVHAAGRASPDQHRRGRTRRERQRHGARDAARAGDADALIADVHQPVSFGSPSMIAVNASAFSRSIALCPALVTT